MFDIQKFLELVKFVILGIVQGLTEPLPISSSGHVVIVREFFDLHISGLTFEIVVNFGSLIAIIIVYRHTIVRLLQNFFRYLIWQENMAKHDFYFGLLVIIATIPIGIIGLLIKDFIETEFSSLIFVAIALIITGIFLWLIRHLQGEKVDEQISIREALIIGFAQTIALIPGISRSGTTIVAAMLVGLKREVALRFSFLLYIPVSIGVTIFSLSNMTADQQLIIPFIIAAITAMLATYISLKWFIQVMIKGKLIYFTYYCFIVGIGVLGLNQFL